MLPRHERRHVNLSPSYDELMPDELIISADSHVLEPGNLWQERIDREFRERAPRVFFDEKANKYKFGGEGIPTINYSGLFAMNKRGEEMAVHMAGPASERDAPPGGWNPERRLDDQAVDGVWAEVLYSSLGFPMFRIEDAAYQAALFRAYNDWLAEFCAFSPERLIGMALIPLADVDAGIAELNRIRARGLKGVMIFASPPPERPFSSRAYDRFWAAAQDLQTPVGLHILTGYGRPSKQMLTDLPPMEFFAGLMELSDEVIHSLTQIVFSGVLERFPGVRLVSAENEIGWIAFWLHMADQWWERYRKTAANELTMKPSEYFKRQVFATFLEDPVGVHDAALPQVGYDNLMWGNDYPHGSSTWPHSRQVIDRVLAGVSPANRAKLIRENCVKLFDLKVPSHA